MLNYRYFTVLATLILRQEYKRATKYFSPTFVLRATRRGKVDGRAKTVEILFTVGRPNWADRQFIKKAKMAGEPFPIKKIQVKA